MNDCSEEKRRLERTATEQFVRLYNKTADTPLRLVRQQDRPDAILEDGAGRRLGMEIAHLFYDAEEAMLVLGRPRGRSYRRETVSGLIGELNKLLEKKRLKRENYTNEIPCSLLIRNASLEFGWRDLQRRSEELVVPTGVFQDIWLLSRERGRRSVWALVRLG